MDNRDKLSKIIDLVMESFPQLEGVLVEGSIEEPTSITFITAEEMLNISEMHNSELDQYFEDLEEGQLKLPFDDDDEGGGMLQ